MMPVKRCYRTLARGDTDTHTSIRPMPPIYRVITSPANTGQTSAAPEKMTSPGSRVMTVEAVDNVLFETDFPHPVCLYPIDALLERLSSNDRP